MTMKSHNIESKRENHLIEAKMSIDSLNDNEKSPKTKSFKMMLYYGFSHNKKSFQEKKITPNKRAALHIIFF